MVSNTIQELQLIKRTAWVNEKRCSRGATQEEADRITPYVINAIVYAAVLNGMLYDLEDAMKTERTMNDSVKKVLRMLHHSAEYAHGEIYRVFDREIDGFGKLYNQRYDLTMTAIDEHILLEGGAKYYNIALALLRLIQKNNDACGRFRSPALVALYPSIRRLTEAVKCYEDKGHAIEMIINQASQRVLDATRFKKLLTE